MKFSRRTALTLSLSALAAPMLIRPARAACSRLNLDQGIAFTRQDGTKGLARREAGGDVVIDYVIGKGYRQDRRRVTKGVFETSRTVEQNEEGVEGAGPPTYTWTYSPKAVWPEEWVTWHGKVKEETSVAITDEKGTVLRDGTRWTASYSCFDLREVTLSGCTHYGLTVEATFVGEAGSRTQRWVYFTELGFGLETRRDGVTNGLVALTAI